MQKKKFHISDILSVSTTALLSTRGMVGVFDIMGYILGDDAISLIGIGAHFATAQEFVTETLPWTAGVRPPDLPHGVTERERNRVVSAFVEKAAKKYGEFHELFPMPNPPDVSVAAELSTLAVARKKRLH